MTPQMGGNLAFHRRQPVRPCPDETVNSERFGVCIRKTCYRTEQEDRVSESVSKLKELSLKKIAASIFMKAVNVAMNRKDKVHINGLIAVSRIQFGQWNIVIKLYTMLWRSNIEIFQRRFICWCSAPILDPFLKQYMHPQASLVMCSHCRLILTIICVCLYSLWRGRISRTTPIMPALPFSMATVGRERPSSPACTWQIC